MTATNANKRLFAGERKLLRFSAVDAEGAPYDLTGADLFFFIRATSGKTPIGPRLVELSGSDIILSNPTAGVCTVVLSSEQTAALRGFCYYQLCLRVNGAGDVDVLADGTLQFFTGL